MSGEVRLVTLSSQRYFFTSFCSSPTCFSICHFLFPNASVSGFLSISSSIPSCLPYFQFNNLIHFKCSVQGCQLRNLMKTNKYGLIQIHGICCIENLLAKHTRCPLTGRSSDFFLLTLLLSALFRLHGGR